MHSYEDRIRAVELYYRYGKKASVVVMELGYPSTKQLGRWVRIYEEKGDLPRELKPRERYSRTQKIAAVEHYLTHGGCLSYTRRAIGYRIYHLNGLSVKRRRRRKGLATERLPLLRPDAPNLTWSIDFCHGRTGHRSQDQVRDLRG